MLLFPALAALSHRKLSLVSIALGVVWLHFGLTGARYSALFVVVIAPSLAVLSCGLPWFNRLAGKLTASDSEAAGKPLTRKRVESGWVYSAAFAVLILLASPWLGNIGRHNPQKMPVAGLNTLLEQYTGEKIFHSPNWGGYLTLHGWNLSPRLKTFLDDRTDLHDPKLYEDARSIFRAQGEWERLLAEYEIEVLCVPSDSALAQEATESSDWQNTYQDGQIAIFRHCPELGDLP